MQSGTLIAFAFLLLFSAACSRSNKADFSADSVDTTSMLDSAQSVADSSVEPIDDRPEHSPEVDPFDLLFRYETFTSDAQYYDTAKQQVKYYLLDSTVWKTGWYLNRKKQGEWVEYDMEGRIFAKGSYSNGVPIGVWTYYNERGRIVREEQYPDTLQVLYTFPMGDFHPVLFILHRNGEWKRVQLSYDDIEKGGDGLLLKGKLFTGTLIQQDVPTSTWAGLLTFKNGVLNGEDIRGGSRSFNLNGQSHGLNINYEIRYGPVNEEGHYRNDKREGVWNLYVHVGLTTVHDNVPLVAKVRYRKGEVQELLFLDKDVKKENDSTLIYNGVDVLEGVTVQVRSVK